MNCIQSHAEIENAKQKHLIMERTRYSALFRTAVLLAVTGGVVGCKNYIGEGACAPIGLVALDIRVQDAATGLPLSGATVLLTGAEDDSLTVSDDRFLGGSVAGVYAVTVRLGGYSDFTKTGIIVRRAPCGESSTVTLVAALHPKA